MASRLLTLEYRAWNTHDPRAVICLIRMPGCHTQWDACPDPRYMDQTKMRVLRIPYLMELLTPSELLAIKKNELIVPMHLPMISLYEPLRYARRFVDHHHLSPRTIFAYDPGENTVRLTAGGIQREFPSSQVTAISSWGELLKRLYRRGEGSPCDLFVFSPGAQNQDMDNLERWIWAVRSGLTQTLFDSSFGISWLTAQAARLPG